MAFVMRIASSSALGAAMLLGAGLAAAPAQAAFIETLVQQGSNVVAKGSGSLDLAGLTFAGVGKFVPQIVPTDGEIITGLGGTVQSADAYGGFTGPISFGRGSGITANFGSGDFVGISGFLGGLFVPLGYKSGTLSDSATYINESFSSLGVTPGSYVWRWGSGPTKDSFTLRIGPTPPPVPEPSGLLVLGLPLGLLVLLSTRRRRRAHRRFGLRGGEAR